jgi:hypothetical protein
VLLIIEKDLSNINLGESVHEIGFNRDSFERDWIAERKEATCKVGELNEVDVVC